MSGAAQYPEGWRTVKFDDIARSVTERVDDPSAAGVTAYVGLDHLDSDTLKISRWGSPSDVESTKLRFCPGDVIYARRRAYQRKLGVAEFEGICSAHALVLRARPEVCLPGFLPYFLQSDQFHARALDISVGSLSPTINWKTLAVQEFAFPPVDEQRRIVEVLGVADLVITRRQETLKSAHSLREAVVENCIWDRTSNNWAWPLVPLSSIVTEPVKNGVSPPESEHGLGILTVSISSIQDGRFRTGPEVRKWCRPERDVSAFVVASGDAFVVRGNGNRNQVGQIGWSPDAPDLPTIYPDLLMRVRFDERILLPIVATEIWNSRRVHQLLLTRAKSSNGIYKVNGKDLHGHLLPVPSPSHQAELAELVSTIRSIEDQAAISLTIDQRLRAQLREALIGGLDDVH